MIFQADKVVAEVLRAIARAKEEERKEEAEAARRSATVTVRYDSVCAGPPSHCQVRLGMCRSATVTVRYDSECAGPPQSLSGTTL